MADTDADSQTTVLLILTAVLLVFTFKTTAAENNALSIYLIAALATLILGVSVIPDITFSPALLQVLGHVAAGVSVLALITAAAVYVLVKFRCFSRRRTRLSGPEHKCVAGTDDVQKRRPLIRFESSTQDADWCYLPATVMTQVLRRLDAADVCSVRQVSRDWYNAVTGCLENLKPKAFHPEYLMKDFSLLKSLDLSECVEEVTADGMVFMKFLGHLTEISFGRHHNLIASTINDRCLTELTSLKKLKTINLAQCVHITDQGLYCLAQSLPAVKEMNISGCVNVTDRGVHALAQIATLRSLEMPWCLKITDAGIEALTAQYRLKNLNISGCQLVTEAGIVLLAHFPEIESLNLLNTGYSKVCVTDAALEHLSGLSNLKSLSIGGVQLQNARTTDAGIATIVKSFPLEQLCLMWLDISNDAVYTLSKLSSLTSLSLRGCARVTADAVGHLAQLNQLKELNLLNNAWLEVNDDVLESLEPLRDIEKLYIGDANVGNVLTDNGMMTLGGFKKLHTLNLPFFEWQFGGSGLGPLMKLHGLESLDLTGCSNASDSTLQVISRVQSIKHLQLSRCVRITGNGLKHLREMPQLESISLSQCFRIDDEGLLSLSEISSITSLNLSHCIVVSDLGIAQLGKLHKLKSLDLSGCREVRGDGFQSFSSVPLSTLNVSGCPALQDGALVFIGQIKNLTKLELCGCVAITDQGIGQLKNLTNLTGVDVSGCSQLGDLSMHFLSLLPRLTTLKVNFCDLVTDYGVSHLVRLPGLLTAHFDRSQNISDQSLVHLGNCASLTSLRLARCARITDAGVAHLAKLNQLSILSLAQCPFVTDNGIRSLAPLKALASLEY